MPLPLFTKHVHPWEISLTAYEVAMISQRQPEARHDIADLLHQQRPGMARLKEGNGYNDVSRNKAIVSAVMTISDEISFNDLKHYIPTEYVRDSEPDEPGMYFMLMHGRDHYNDQLHDWGFDGPFIGPLKAVHITYNCTINFVFPENLWEGDNSTGPMNVPVFSGCFLFGGKYYGDWEYVHYSEDEIQRRKQKAGGY